MKNNLPVTDREIPLPKGQRLISTTDLKGRITYCNDVFVKISGYSREELIGSAHNIIRHPDMPPIAFANLWDTLKEGKPWMGLVKNRAKSGDFYWVNAYVTPIRESGKVVGYESVRFAPTRDQVERADALYKKVLGGNVAGVLYRSQLKAFAQVCYPFIGATALGIAAFGILSFEQASAALVALNVGASGWTYRLVSAKIKSILRNGNVTEHHPLVALPYTSEPGAFSELSMLAASSHARLLTIIGRIEDQVKVLYQSIAENNALIDNNKTFSGRQREETEQVASAITQMIASIHDISSNINASAERSQDAQEAAQTIESLSSDALNSIETLVSQVESIRTKIESLGASTDAISEATNLISGIAEQTNLLALNAAIEAARAGEHGRGFSVVADEVRSLASRTQESTGRITSVIEQFKKEVGEAVVATRNGEEIAIKGLDKVRESESGLKEIVESVSGMTQRFSEISNIIREQSEVSNQIGEQITSISDLAHESDKNSDTSKDVSDRLNKVSSDLKDFISRF